MSTSSFNQEIANPQYRENYFQVNMNNEYYTIKNYYNYDNSHQNMSEKIVYGYDIMGSRIPSKFNEQDKKKGLEATLEKVQNDIALFQNL